MLYSTAYLPPISFFKSIVSNKETHFIEAFENYQKRSYRNRASIAGANKIINISVPLKQGKNSQQAIKTVEISYDEDWVTHHLENIHTAYSQSAFFEHYIEGISEVLLSKPKYIYQLNQSLLHFILPILAIPTPLSETDNFRQYQTLDLKEQFVNIPLRTKLDLESLNQCYYPQVFEDRYGFIQELSIIDLIFCMGPEAEIIIRN